MNALTLPRKAAALQYKAWRLPATVVEKQLVSSLLADDSRLRLGYERALGSLDETAGRLFRDAELERRGTALRRRAQVLETATELEAKAQARKAEAEQTLESEKQRAREQREQAQQGERESVQQALADEQADKRRVSAKAKNREQTEKQRVEQQAQERKQAAERARKDEERRIAAEVEADTAAPKAQLDDAVELKRAADSERSQADRMAELADAEAQSRRAEREAARNSK
jgi:hypothetical protein